MFFSNFLKHLHLLLVLFSDFSKHLLLTKAKIHIMLKEDSNYLVVVVLSLPFPYYKSGYCYCL